MSGFDPERLRQVRTLDDVVELLADELDWPLDASSLEDAVFDYEPEDLGLATEQVPQLQSLRELRPMTASQPWGIFFVELAGPRLPITPLRQLLRGLVTKRRARPDGQRTWDRDDLLLFTSTTDSEGVELHLLAFHENPGSAPEIRSLPWNPVRSTQHQLQRLARELLPRLEWPEDPEDGEAWRKSWRDAFRLRHGEALRSAADLAVRMAGVAIDLRDAIDDQLDEEAGDGPFTTLREEIRKELDPDVDNEAMADMCAQTLVSGALTARVIDPVGFGASPVLTAVPLANPFLNAFFQQVHDQVAAIDLDAAGFDGLVADLRATNVEDILDRFGSTDAGGDPVIHFYEKFLAAYDAGIRAEVGAYYTPEPVVEAIVRLVDDALRGCLGLADGVADASTWGEVTDQLGFAMPKGIGRDEQFVSMLDPATGTGTFLVSWLRRAEQSFKERNPEGGWDQHLRKRVLPHLRAFELLLAPYAIAHLKLAMQVGPDAATEAASSILLTDTLEWPGDAPRLDDFDPVAAEGQRAGQVKDEGRPTVIIGNPPYGRVARARTGGWVANADGPRPALMDDWIAQANHRSFAHSAALYNQYVYFFRWAMWKVFEQASDVPGVVAFITGSSWLDGPGFIGLREAARSLCSDVWIVDLGGDSRGTNPEENVFDILTPVVIAIFVRARADNVEPASIFYRRVVGTRSEKLAGAWAIRSPLETPDSWTKLSDAVGQPFRPKAGGAAWGSLPLLADLMPWQQPGAMFSRKWPIAPDALTLERRWSKFVGEEDRGLRADLFPTPNNGRTIWTQVRNLPTLAALDSDAEAPPIVRYQWRAWDRQWGFEDARLAKTESPALWQSLSRRQVFLAMPASHILGPGPALQVMTGVPDKDVFHGRGGKDILPLYRDAASNQPNVTAGLLEAIAESHRVAKSGVAQPTPEHLLAYVFALLSTPGYQVRFSDELHDKDIRVPITADPELWAESVELGEQLARLHTFGDRFAEGSAPRLAEDHLVVLGPITRLPEDRSDFSYDKATQTLLVSDGVIRGVKSAVWDFTVSGWPVVTRWLEQRTRSGRGRRSSELDLIRPDRWHPEWTDELLEVLRALDGSIRLQPQQDDLLARILDGPLIRASELPNPTEAERKVPPTIRGRPGQAELS